MLKAASLVLCFAVLPGATCNGTEDARAGLKFKERTVAGTSSDLMIVRHLRLEGTNAEIGAKLAEIARDRHGVTDPRTDDIPNLTKHMDWLSKTYPEQLARVEGAARLYGKKVGENGFDPTSLGYNLGACSVVFYPGSAVKTGHAMLSRNYDFPTGSFAEITGRSPKPGARSMTGDPYVIEMHPDKGYSSLFMCSYDLIGGAVDGINEKGLAVALLADDASPDKQPANGFGLSELTLPRFLLDKCANAKESRKALEKVPYFYTFTPCHYIVCDASGDSFVWEITPDLKQRFIVDGKGKPQVVTNHLLAKHDAKALPDGNSFDRFRRLVSEIDLRDGKLSPEDVREVNSCVAVPLESRGHATLWHSVYDLKDKSLSVSFFLGNGKRTDYLTFGLRD